MRIRVDNLASDITDDELRKLFECFGRVASVDTRRQGQATIDMPSKAAAKEAIAGLHGQTVAGFQIAVSELKENAYRPSRKPRRRRR